MPEGAAGAATGAPALTSVHVAVDGAYAGAIRLGDALKADSPSAVSELKAADLVLATDEPSRLVEAVKISRRTARIVWQNIGVALGAKAAVLTAGAFGVVSMWAAVIADVGVTLLAVANALRLLGGARRALNRRQ